MAGNGDQTVILATSRPRVAQALCQRVAILHQGRVVAQLTPAEWSAPDSAPVYQIRVNAHVSRQRAAWFGDFEMTWLDNGDTLLSGVVRDQAALHGALAKIRDMGLPLISATRLEPDLERIFHQLVELSTAQ
jgi:ABC-2 type transport system ATP-binding protein